MKKIISKKIIAIMLIILTLFSTIKNITYARSEISEATLYKVQDCTTKLHYFSKKQNRWINVICYYTEFNNDGNKYPGYCLDADYDGVGEAGSYTVDITEVLDRDDIWRAIVNGYPYKTPSELGVDTVLDAYMVTKRAVHSLLYDVNVKEQYRAFDAHGEKVIEEIEKLTNIRKIWNTDTFRWNNYSISNRRFIRRWTILDTKNECN